MPQQYLTPEEVTRLGEDLYLSKLRQQLEPKHTGEYVAIEVKSGDHFVNPDLLTAIETAREKYPDELLHVVQVGDIHKRTIGHRTTKYAWHLR